MNAKRVKELRRKVADLPSANPEITFHDRWMFNGIPHEHRVVNPIRYPAGSQRRVYQDMKRAA